MKIHGTITLGVKTIRSSLNKVQIICFYVELEKLWKISHYITNLKLVSKDVSVARYRTKYSTMLHDCCSIENHKNAAPMSLLHLSIGKTSSIEKHKNTAPMSFD